MLNPARSKGAGSQSEPVRECGFGIDNADLDDWRPGTVTPGASPGAISCKPAASPARGAVCPQGRAQMDRTIWCSTARLRPFGAFLHMLRSCPRVRPRGYRSCAPSGLSNQDIVGRSVSGQASGPIANCGGTNAFRSM